MRTWNIISKGSPYGTAIVKNEKNKEVEVVLNRATRRRLGREQHTRLERLVDQEVRIDYVRDLVRKRR